MSFGKTRKKGRRMWTLRKEWTTPYYRGTIVYIAVFVTLIFGFQMYRYFVAAPASEIRCPETRSAMALVPVIGVLFDG